MTISQTINSDLASIYYQDELESIMMDVVSKSISKYKSPSGININKIGMKLLHQRTSIRLEILFG